MSESVVPQLRFEGFYDAWGYQTLGDLGHPYGGLTGKTKEDFGHGAGFYVTYMDVFKHPKILDASRCGRVEIDPKQHEVKEGDALFTVSSETPEEVGMASVWLGTEVNVYLNSFCFGLRPCIDVNSSYFAYVLRSGAVRRQFELLAQGISRFNISKIKAMYISIPFPSIPEQGSIGSLCTLFDSLIEQHRRKYHQLQQTKVALMRRMFPQGDADEPELRFGVYSGAWSRATLDDVCDLLIGRTPPRNNQHMWGGDHHWVSIADLTQGRTILSTKETVSTAGAMLGRRIKKGTVLLSFKLTIGRVARAGMDLYTNEAIAALPIKPGSALVDDFLMWFLDSRDLAGGTNRAAMGVTLNQEALRSIPLMLPPSPSEQRAIADCFNQLDCLISAEQHYIDKLQQVKSGLLQKIFV